MAHPLRERVLALKSERNAIILAHNYTVGEVQDIADHVGDSLGLARTAAQTSADVIVFCGVHFMAETAAILCPEKTVLMPDEMAGCPMANMLSARQLQAFREQHPGARVVAYVNSTAAVKAQTDICCTSANAVGVVKTISAQTPVLFVPDRNLGHYVSTQLGRELILWDGFCPTHERILPEHIEATRRAHPNAKLAVHPECRPSVVAMADFVGSTSGILRWCGETDYKTYLIATEIGLLHTLQTQNPGKTFIPASPISDCPNMKLSSVEKILWCLEDMRPQITVPPEIAQQARRPIEKMLEVLA